MLSSERCQHQTFCTHVDGFYKPVVIEVIVTSEFNYLNGWMNVFGVIESFHLASGSTYFKD